MPLHLLGKKSWNVYNPDNIARVRQDEAAAKAQAEEGERQLRNAEAERRLRALSSTKSPPAVQRTPDERTPTTQISGSAESSRKRRRLAGEDETDAEIRLAKSNVETSSARFGRGSLLDSKGNVSLVPECQSETKPQRQPEREDEAAGVRLKDAVGFNNDGKPWYTNRERTPNPGSEVGKDVWGNEDPRRREREQRRMNADDPLLAMKKGINQLRENEKQRKEWIDQRERDLHEVERLAPRKKKHRLGNDSDEDSLDGFNLNALSSRDRGSSDTRSREIKRTRSDRHHRHRSRSPERSHHHHPYRRRSADD